MDSRPEQYRETIIVRKLKNKSDESNLALYFLCLGPIWEMLFRPTIMFCGFVCCCATEICSNDNGYICTNFASSFLNTTCKPCQKCRGEHFKFCDCTDDIFTT